MTKELSPFTASVIAIIKSIPRGRVMTYGQIAAICDSPRSARQVARILHTMSNKYQLPWQRVISSNGKISIKNPIGHQLQIDLLSKEGVEVDLNAHSINLKKYQYRVD